MSVYYTNGASCTPPVDCTVRAGKRMWVNGVSSWNPAATQCFDSCSQNLKQFVVVGLNGVDRLSSYHKYSDGSRRALYEYTGTPCSNEPAATGTDTTGEPDVADKFTPKPQTGENCGYVNGKYVCLKKLQPDKCWVNDDGSRICAENAPSPPKPANAAGTAPATPNSTVSACMGDGSCVTYQYFNQTTVSQSGTPASPGGDPSNENGGTGPGQGGSGEGEGEEPGSGGTASGGTLCDNPPTCDGDPVGCAQLFQQWRARCPISPQQSEVLDSIGATQAERDGDLSRGGEGDITLESLEVDGGFGGGQCPAPITLSVMGRSMSMDVWQRACDLALLFAPITMVMGYMGAAGIIVRGVKS